MNRLRKLIWALAALATIGLAVLLLLQPGSSRQQEPSSQVSFGGPFTLTGVDGQPFSSSRLARKPHAMFFGFTHCPDACPTTLARLVRLRGQLGQGADPFEILFVSVDPERDGASEMRSYISLFEQPIIGLTGTPEQIAQVKRQFGIFSQKVPDGNGSYSVDHTATVLLFDRGGRFVATIAPDESDAVALDKLRRIAG